MDTASTDDIERRAAGGDCEAQLILALRFDSEGRGDSAVQWFRRAAQAGDLRAKTVLAMRLLSFAPFDAMEGTRWANEAAREGSADATHLLAIITAEGIGGTPQSWHGALDYLARAAELGNRKARIELAALAGDWPLAQEIRRGRNLSPAEYSRLRASIDIAALLRVQNPEFVSSAPRIALAQGFLSPQICDWLIDVGRPILRRAQIVDYHTGGARDDPIRDNSATVLMPGMGDLIIALVRARIATLTGLPLTGFEPTAVLQYKVGEQFHPHHDYLDTNTPGHSDDFARQGQRVVTFLVYLNDDYDGGETAFPAVKARYKGPKGNALFFWNVAPNGAPDPRTLHAGLPPTRGEKWLLSQWIRLRAS